MHKSNFGKIASCGLREWISFERPQTHAGAWDPRKSCICRGCHVCCIPARILERADLISAFREITTGTARVNFFDELPVLAG